MESKILKILAIDDIQDNLISLGALVKEVFANAIFLSALSGKEGLKLASTEDPDVILLDILMPDMDGFEVCKRIKANKELSIIPVVFITAIKGDRQSRIKALEIGAEAFLAKPIDETELIAQIRAMAKIKAANIYHRDEKERLASLVVEKMRNLNLAQVETVSLVKELKTEKAALQASEERIREANDKYSTIFQTSPYGIIITRPADGKIIEVNDAFSTISGYSNHEALTSSTINLNLWINKEDRDYILLQLNKGEKVYEMEVLFCKKNGQIISATISSQTIYLNNEPYILSSINDITKRKQADAQVRIKNEELDTLNNKLTSTLEKIKIANAELYRANVELEAKENALINEKNFSEALLESIPGFFYVYNEEQKLIKWNKKHETITGYSGDELKNMTISDWYDENELSRIAVSVKKIFEFGHDEIDVNLRIKDGSKILTHLNGERFMQDGKSYLVGVGIDITERKKAEEAIRLSEERYRLILNASPDDITIADLEGRIIMVSPAAYKMFGFTEDMSFVGLSIMDFIVPQDRERALAQLASMFQENPSAAVEYNGIKHDGTTFNIEVNAECIRDTDNNPVQIVIVVRDITQRKVAEEELRESETKLRTIIETSPDGISIASLDGKLQFITAKTTSMWGYDSAEELYGRSMMEFIEPSFHEKASHLTNEMFKGNLTDAADYLMVRKDGTTFYAEANASVLYNDNQTPTGILFIVRDITQRKLAEAKQRESDLQYKLLIETANEGILVAQDGLFKFYNSALRQLIGCTDEELKTTPFIDFIHDDYKELVISNYKKRTLGQYVDQRYTVKMLSKDKSVRWIELSGAKIEWEGKPATLNFITDITDRQLMEEALRESEKKYNILFQNSPDAYLLIADGIFVECNKASEILMHGTKEQIIGKTPDAISPEYQPDGRKSSVAAAELIRLALELGNKTFEWIHRRLDGTDFFAQVSITAIMLNNKQTLFVNWRDITQQKLAEEKVGKISSHYQAIIDKAPDGIVLLNVAGDFKYASSSAKRIFGYDENEELKANQVNCTHPDDVRMVMGHLTTIYEDPTYTPTLQYRFLTKSKQWIWIESTFTNLLANDNVEAIVINFRDITERITIEEANRAVERALRINSTRLEMAMTSANMAWWEIDLTTGYITFEKQKAIMLGYEPSQFEHYQDFLVLAHPQDIGIIEDAILQLRNGEAEKYEIEYRILSKGGTYKWLYEIGSIAMKDDAGKATIVTGLVTDVTERKLADAALFKSEEMLRDSQIIAGLGGYVLDINTGKWNSSEVLDTIFGIGYSFERNIDNWTALIHPEDRERMTNYFAIEVLEKGNKFDTEYRIIKNDTKETIWVHGLGIVSTDPNDLQQKMRGTIQDITVQKLNKDAIREREQRYRALFQDNQAVMLITNPVTLEIIDANEAASKYYGYTNEQITALQITQINTASEDEVRYQINLAIREQQSKFFLKHKLASGAIRDVEAYNGPIYIDGQALLYSLVHDITDRRNTEREIFKTTTLLRSILESSPEIVVYALDKDYQYLTFNSKHRENILNTRNIEISVGMNMLDVYSNQTERESAKANYDKALTGQSFIVTEEWGDDELSRLTWLNYYSPIHDGAGNSIGLTCFVLNITERKQTEAIKAKNKELIIQNADKDRFMAILAHDLKSPFVSILGFLNILSANVRRYDIDKIESQINIINNSAHHTYKLLEDILLWARAQSGKLPFEPAIYSLTNICDEVIGDLKLNASNKTIALSHFQEGAEIKVYADINMLKTILRNLVANAIKFTNAGGSIQISAKKESETITIYVTDTGIGIQASSIPKMFDFALNITTTGTAEEKGTGLGLLLCREFVEKHGGKIWVESIVGEGSTFQFTLPGQKYLESQTTEIPKKENDENSSNSENIELINESINYNLNILIVEPNELLQASDNQQFKRYSKSIVFATTGGQAVELCRNHPEIDMVLIDVRLPDISGYEATKQIREFNKSAIIIAQTAFSLSGVREKALTAGCNDYLPKPFTKELLDQLFEKHFSQ